MQEKIFEFSIAHPLTPARRNAIEKLLDENSHHFPWPVTYSWNEKQTHLFLDSTALKLEVVFYKSKVVVFRDAPFWIRMMLSHKRQNEMKTVFSTMLEDLGFFGTTKRSLPKNSTKTAKQ